MYQLILMLSLFPTQPKALAQKSTLDCSWPNVCTAEKVAPASQSVQHEITTCQWPNVCTAAAPVVTTCQWPNTCAI